MSDIDPNKLKVVELRAELASRGLDTKGNKAVLVKRLEDALNLEFGNVTVTKDTEITEDDDEQDDQNISGFDPQDSQGEDSFMKEDLEQPQPEIKEEYEEEPQEFTDFNEMKSIKQEPFDNEIKKEKFEYNQEAIKEEPQSPVEVKQEPQAEHQRGEKRGRSPSWDRKRNRSRSPSHERKSDSKAASAQPVEDFDDALVTLDTYNSDLNLSIAKDRYSAFPLTQDGFAFMWSGARSSYGFIHGKVCFEVKVIEHLDISHLPDDEPNPHVVRVGVSVDETSMQLGEEPLSWGYGGTAKASTNCQFKDYGTPFMEGDAVCCFVNLESDPIELAFSKNGNPQGVAYYIPRDQLGDRAVFPHILTKNCSFDINFGQKETPFFPLPQEYADYIFIGCTSLDDRIRGPKEPARREDCEMIMMCGLPGAGKSTWAAEYCKLHPDKKYNVLGTNNIIDKMKVMGLPRKRNYAGRWDVLIDKSTKCLNKMMEIGSKKKRNFILDQTNVYASAQRRKMRPFEGFKRRAVVLVPTDEEFRRRVAKREKEEGKDVPESAVLEMKANFVPPEAGTIFDSVEWVELPEQEAKPLIEQYRREGRAALPPPEKRFRPNDRGGHSQRGGRFGPPLQNRDRDRDSRGRMEERRYNSPGRGGNYGSPNRGGMGYGYRDNRSDRGGYNRNSRGLDHRGGSSRGGPNRNGPPRGGSNRGGGYYGRDFGGRDGGYGGRDGGYGGRDGGYGGRDGGYGGRDSGYGSRDNSYGRDGGGYGRDNSYGRDSSYGRDNSGYNRESRESRDRSYQGGGQAPKQEPKSSSQSQGYGQSGYSSGYGGSQNYGGGYGQSYGQSYNSGQGYGGQQTYAQSQSQSSQSTPAAAQPQWKQSSTSAGYGQNYGSSYTQPSYGSTQSQTQASTYSQPASTTAQQQQQSYYQQYYNQQWSQWNQQNPTGQQTAAAATAAAAQTQQPYYSQYYNSSSYYTPTAGSTGGGSNSGGGNYATYSSQTASQQK